MGDVQNNTNDGLVLGGGSGANATRRRRVPKKNVPLTRFNGAMRRLRQQLNKGFGAVLEGTRRGGLLERQAVVHHEEADDRLNRAVEAILDALKRQLDDTWHLCSVLMQL